MTIQYASDLHLEFDRNDEFINSGGIKPIGDILLLAGDIIFLENEWMEENPFFEWCSRNFRETIIVPGNHEYYEDPTAKGDHRKGFPLEKSLASYEHYIRKNVRYLNNQSIVFGDTEIFATTLWTVPEPRLYGAIQYGMNDYRQISYRGHYISPQEMTEVHYSCRGWLDRALRESSAKHKIVLTHHCPSTFWLFQSSDSHRWLDSAFHVDMSKFIAEHDIEYWIYGHTHTKSGSGSVVMTSSIYLSFLCNQLGYVELGEDSEFQRDASIEIWPVSLNAY